MLRPLTTGLFRLGVTANQVTIAACLVSVALGALLAVQPHRIGLFALVPAWLLVRMALNAIDGMLAREFGQASSLGAYLNELTDVVSDAALYLPFALVPGANPWLVIAVVLLSIFSELAGVLGVMVRASRRYDGPMGKSDRAFVFGLLGLLLALEAPIAAALPWVWSALCVLLVVTIVNRVRRGLSEIATR